MSKKNKNKKLTRFRYFAYGSNMCRKRLEDRVGKVNKITTGFLNNYEMLFNCGTTNISFANIAPHEGEKTFGVVYALTKRQLRILDRYEGMYRRKVVEINGRNTIAYISPLIIEEFSTPPDAEYVRIILRGFLENQYVEGYRRLRQKIFNYFKVYLNV